MKFIVSAFASALALAAVLAVPAALIIAAPANAAAKIYAKKSSGPLKGVIYGNRRRPGGYSYKYSDVSTPGSRSNPTVTGLYPETGALDGDFFFQTTRGPYGGYTPYIH